MINGEETPNHELQLLQYISNQLEKYSNAAVEVQAILTELNAEKISFECLRAKALAVYNNEKENKNKIYHNESFYCALFVFLLMLTKYAPIDSDCAIMHLSIEEQCRILTPSGYQYDGQDGGVRNFFSDSSYRHPITRRDVSDPREIAYIHERINAIEAKKNVWTPEIFYPRNIRRNPARTDGNSNAALGCVTGVLLGMAGSIFFVLFAPVAVISAITILSLIFGPGVIGAAIGKYFSRIRDCFSFRFTPVQLPLSLISDNTRALFSRFENNASNDVSTQRQPTQELNSTPTYSLVGERLSNSRENSKTPPESSLQAGPSSAETMSLFSPTSSRQSQQSPRELFLRNVEADAERVSVVAAEKTRPAPLR